MKIIINICGAEVLNPGTSKASSNCIYCSMDPCVAVHWIVYVPMLSQGQTTATRRALQSKEPDKYGYFNSPLEGQLGRNSHQENKLVVNSVTERNEFPGIIAKTQNRKVLTSLLQMIRYR